MRCHHKGSAVALAPLSDAVTDRAATTDRSFHLSCFIGRSEQLRTRIYRSTTDEVVSALAITNVFSNPGNLVQLFPSIFTH